MPFYRVLTVVYDIQTHILFELSPLYILKHNTFQAHVWPHFKIVLANQLPPYDDYLHCN